MRRTFVDQYSHHTRRTLRRTALCSAAVVAALVISGCSGQQSNRSASAVEDPWIVSLGDSFISGEAGRWAGNQTWSTAHVDALSAGAYFDSPSGELIDRCHRSTSAPVHIGIVKSMNFACSGATTNTRINDSGNFKPGIDFYDEGGNQGQALMLQEFAQTNDVRMIALSIGGNDFKFSPIMEECVKSYLKPSVFGTFCNEDPVVQTSLSAEAIDRVRTNTTQAVLNIATAMENAGYTDNKWTLGLQLYPRILPEPSSMRYTESGYDRQLAGGCGVRDIDTTWALNTVIPIVNTTFQEAVAEAQRIRPSLKVVTLDTTNAFAERTLCDKNVNRVRDTGGAKSWNDANAVDLSEWVMEINMVNPNDTYSQESLHPNYWGQLALRSCWRQVWNYGDVQGGACVRAENGLNEYGEPNMRLQR